MIREATATGKTVEEAIDLACLELGIPREDVQFEIIDLPKKGIFRNTPAKVKVYIEEDDPTPTQKPSAPSAPSASSAPPTPPTREATPEKPFAVTDEMRQKADFAQKYVSDILGHMGLTDATVTAELGENGVTLHLAGEGLGVIIGRRGETLDALQYLTGLSANRGEGTYIRTAIDSGDYRQKREKTLEALAAKLAGTVARTGRSCTLEPMNPYERRIIHAAVSKVQGVSSASVGEEPNRKVVITSTTRKPQGGKSSGRDNRGRGRPVGRDNRQGQGRDNRPGGGYNRDNPDNRQGGGPSRDNRQGSGPSRDNRQGSGPSRDNRQGGGPSRDNRQGGGYNRDNRIPRREHTDGYNRPPQDSGPKVEKTQVPEESGTKLYAKIKLD